jgi:SAM-dependent methyltransferase
MTGPTREQLDALEPWDQNFTFPNGLEVGAWPADRLDPLFEGVELAGKTALDIGCNGGNQTLRMDQAGADVVGTDVNPRYESQFALVKEAFGMRARYLECSVENLPPEYVYDVVLFAGVIYHVHDPFRALLNAWRATRTVLLLESDTTPGDERPVAYFVKNANPWEYANWWLPTTQCLIDMCRSLGDVWEIRDVTGEYPGKYGARVMLQIWCKEGAR